jgi:hypothetical protein
MNPTALSLDMRFPSFPVARIGAQVTAAVGLTKTGTIRGA